MLENKLNIGLSSELNKEEERISKIKCIEIYKNNLTADYEPGSFECLKFIHEYMFGDIYFFGGQIRTVNIAKGNFAFVPAKFLESAIQQVEDIEVVDIEHAIIKYVEMNIVHPFREGNGRSSRLWLDDLLSRKFRLIVDWENIESNVYHNAMIKSSYDESEIIALITSNLKESSDEYTFFRGLNQSYNYEELYEYDAKELYQQFKTKERTR